MVDSIRIILVDDHNMVRMGLKAYFASLPDIQVVGEAATGSEAVRLAAELTPDVILMDLIMPGMDGVEAIRQIMQATPATRIIALTMYRQEQYMLDAIRAGARGYSCVRLSRCVLGGFIFGQ